MPSSTAVIVAPARRLRGRLRVPGDKSISHRYALLAALAEGQSRLTNFSSGADCRSTVSCLRRLGVAIEDTDAAAGTLTVMGRGIGCLSSPSEALDGELGNHDAPDGRRAGGTPVFEPVCWRCLLSSRPMRRVIQPLERMGARINATDGHALLTSTAPGCAPSPTNRGAERPGQERRALAGLHAEGRRRPEPAATAITPSGRSRRSAAPSR